MLHSADGIRHEGVVASVDGRRVSVDVEVGEACGSCASRSSCALGRARDTRRIVVDVPAGEDYSAGERVDVSVRSSMGAMAVLLCYVCPLAVLLAVLASALGAGYSDGVAATASLAAVAVYYAVLYLFRGRISKKVCFTISKSKI